MRGRGLAALALTLLLLAAAEARAIDGDASGLAVSARAFEGLPHCVLLEGTTAYVGLDSGLGVVDVADPAAPVLLAHVPLPGPLLDLARGSSALFGAAGEWGFVSFDTTTPSAPSVVANLTLPGARSVAAQGDIAFVGIDLAGAEGVSVVDATAAPAEIGFVSLPNGPEDLALSGTTLWAALGSDAASPFGLQAVDVSTPSTPAARGLLPTIRPAHGLALTGSTACVATGIALRGDLVVADISSAAAPAELGRTTLPDNARGVVMDGTLALVAASRSGLVRVDVSNPAAPQRRDSVSTARESVGVATGGGLALLADRSSTGIAALSVLDAPPLPSLPSLTGLSAFAEATDVALDGGIVHVLRRDALHELDSAAGLAGLGAFALPGADFSGLAVEGGLAAIAEGPAVHLVDVSDPTAPAQAGTLVVPVGVAVDLVVASRVLHVATGRSVEMYDVSTPSSPLPLGAWDGPEQDDAIAVDGLVAATGGGTTLQLLDVATPGAPAALGSLVLPDQLQCLAIAQDLVVAGCLSSTLFIDVSDPLTPAIIGQVPMAASDVALSSGFAFLASGLDGVRVIDVSDPALPVEVAFVDTSGDAVGVASDGVSIALATSSSQAWWMDCAACAAGCLAQARLTGPSPGCEGRPLVFDASGSTLAGCTGGAAAYRWFVDGALVPAATGTSLDVAPLSLGPHVVEVEISCDVDPGCADLGAAFLDVRADSFPVLDPASLRVAKVAGGEELSWQILSGSGETNVHRDLDPSVLADSAITSATIVSRAPGTTDLNTFSPGLGACAYFTVFGRSACDGSSLVP